MFSNLKTHLPFKGSDRRFIRFNVYFFCVCVCNLYTVNSNVNLIWKCENCQFQKNSQKVPPKNPKISPKYQLFPKNSQKMLQTIANKFLNTQDFENIQFPTLHLEAKDPSGLFIQRLILKLRSKSFLHFTSKNLLSPKFH